MQVISAAPQTYLLVAHDMENLDDLKSYTIIGWKISDSMPAPILIGGLYGKIQEDYPDSLQAYLLPDGRIEDGSGKIWDNLSAYKDDVAGIVVNNIKRQANKYALTLNDTRVAMILDGFGKNHAWLKDALDSDLKTAVNILSAFKKTADEESDSILGLDN